MQITYFGTGAALNPVVDTMHMCLEDEDTQLYIDVGGGMSLMQKILRKEIRKPEHLWITHCHSDHILGIVHLLRIHKSGSLIIYCSQNIQHKIEQLMDIVGQSKLYHKQIEEQLITYVSIDTLPAIHVATRTLEPINLHSTKTEQYGFLLYQDDKTLTFFGDEAINILQRNDLTRFERSDRLLCEAFCTEDYKDTKKPHEKNHITALETGTIAHRLQVNNLIISHINNHLPDRIQQLDDIKNEAAQVFHGNIVVPQDNDTVSLR